MFKCINFFIFYPGNKYCVDYEKRSTSKILSVNPVNVLSAQLSLVDN